MASDSAAVCDDLKIAGQASELPNSATHARISRALAYYATPEDRELAIENLKWLSVYAPTHSQQMDCRMLLLAMRNAQSFGVT
jgi:hypothetical protein